MQQAERTFLYQERTTDRALTAVGDVIAPCGGDNLLGSLQALEILIELRRTLQPHAELSPALCARRRSAILGRPGWVESAARHRGNHTLDVECLVWL